MKVWGVIPITKGEFIFIETILISFFFILTIFFFWYRFPEYVTSSEILFHAKYIKYAALFTTFMLIIETQYFLNQFIQKQLRVNKKQKEQIEFQKDNITSSIRYAGRIQSALLPPDNEIPENFEHFVYYKPKDIVSGDYYWISRKGAKTVFVAADCTGHGVPGAFMSVMGIAFLNEIVNISDTLDEADVILNKLRKKVINVFYESKTNDGMDMALCIIDSEKMEVQFAGAFNPLLIVRKLGSNNTGDDTELAKKRIQNKTHELLHFKGDRFAVSKSIKEKPFNKQTIKLLTNDSLYIFSDGYIDQFGGKKGNKFFIKQFRKLLLEMQNLPMAKQKEMLEKTLIKWRQPFSGKIYEQLDDILVLGIKIKP